MKLRIFWAALGTICGITALAEFIIERAPTNWYIIFTLGTVSSVIFIELEQMKELIKK